MRAARALVWVVFALAPACMFEPAQTEGLEDEDARVAEPDGGGDAGAPGDAIVHPDAAPPETCGNGAVDPGEECDDPNSISGDGCTGCLVDPGWVCAPACVNPAPSAVADMARGDEDTPLSIAVTANDLDLHDDELVVASVTTPSRGTVMISGGRLIVYRPELDYNGPDSFAYTVQDRGGSTSTAAVTVQIAAIDDPPVAEADEVRTAYQVARSVMLRAQDPENDPLSFEIVRQPSFGSATAMITGLATYTPQAGFSGIDSFSFVARGSSAVPSNTATVSVVVLPPDWRVEVADWPVRRRLTISSTIAISDFVVPVFLDPARIDYSLAQPDGDDLRFYRSTSGDLSYEIERWTPGGETIVWVRIPYIASSTTTSFYMYYGNPAAGSGEDRNGTWPRDYDAVFHFADGVRESTTGGTAVDNGTSDAPGFLGRGRELGGVNYVSIGAGAFSSSEGTAAMWINIPAFVDINDHAMLFYGVDFAGGSADGFGPDSELHLGLDSNERLRFYARGSMGQPDVELAINGGPGLDDGQWHQVAVTWEQGKGSPDQAAIYLDGLRVATGVFNARTFTSAVTRLGSPFAISRRLIGTIDEVQISDVAHSPLWMRLQYRAMTDRNYVSVGPEDDGRP